MSTINIKEHKEYLRNKFLESAFIMFLYKANYNSSKQEMIFALGCSYNSLEEYTTEKILNLSEPDPQNINTTKQDIANFIKNKMEKEIAQEVLDFLYKQINVINSKNTYQFYKFIEMYKENAELKANKYAEERLYDNDISNYHLRKYPEDFRELLRYYLFFEKDADRLIEIVKSKNIKERYKLMEEWKKEDAKEKGDLK